MLKRSVGPLRAGPSEPRSFPCSSQDAREGTPLPPIPFPRSYTHRRKRTRRPAVEPSSFRSLDPIHTRGREWTPAHGPRPLRFQDPLHAQEGERGASRPLPVMRTASCQPADSGHPVPEFAGRLGVMGAGRNKKVLGTVQTSHSGPDVLVAVNAQYKGAIKLTVSFAICPGVAVK